MKLPLFFFHDPQELLKKVSAVIDYRNNKQTFEIFDNLLKKLENLFPNLLVFSNKIKQSTE